MAASSLSSSSVHLISSIEDQHTSDSIHFVPSHLLPSHFSRNDVNIDRQPFISFMLLGGIRLGSVCISIAGCSQADVVVGVPGQILVQMEGEPGRTCIHTASCGPPCVLASLLPAVSQEPCPTDCLLQAETRPLSQASGIGKSGFGIWEFPLNGHTQAQASPEISRRDNVCIRTASPAPPPP